MTNTTTLSPERQPADAGGGLLPCPGCGDTDPVYVGFPDAPADKMFVGCETCGFRALACATRKQAARFWNRRAPAPQAQPDARAVEGEPVGYFLHNGHEWEEVANQFIGDPDVRPLYLSAPATDENEWRRSREEEARIVNDAIRQYEDHPAQAAFDAREEVSGNAADRVLALHPAAPTDEVGRS